MLIAQENLFEHIAVDPFGVPAVRSTLLTMRRTKGFFANSIVRKAFEPTIHTVTGMAGSFCQKILEMS